MEEYGVVEHHIKSNGNGNANGNASENADEKVSIIKAINFRLPTIITFSSSVDLQFDAKVQVKDDNKVYANENAVGEILSRQCSTDITVNTDYDIKYTGGYSKDGKIIYIDRDLPKTLAVDGKDVDLLQSIALHHELVEKWMIDDAYDYQYAHLIATGVEKEYIDSIGVKWESYDAELGKQLRLIYGKKLRKSPRNLDLSPYLATNDQEALKEIRDSMEI
ncbi:MAG: hypothetical protein ACP5RF_03925 [Candidatus Micrarchaeia archaeon]